MHRLGAVVMASGNSRRFCGGNKLLAPLGGRALLCHTLLALPSALFAARVVVTRSREIAALATSLGFDTLLHTLPDVSDTIRLGVSQMAGMDGCLFCVGDQPFLSPATVTRMAAAFQASPKRILRAAFGSREGNPALFPAALFPELGMLAVGQTGGAVIRRHRALVTLVPASYERELWDVDTQADYERLVNEWNKGV